jgi:hypothetical protein
MRIFLIILILGLLANCANIPLGIKTDEIKVGRFEGKLNLEWKAPNCFLYVPDPKNPLIFHRANGQKIQPKMMYTDGGSIPRLLWNTPNLSPWDFAPAYLIHDWLFEQHHCFPKQSQRFTFEDSALILSEAVKTLIETGCSAANKEIARLLYKSVSTSIAKDLWDNGQCYLPKQTMNGQISYFSQVSNEPATKYQCPFEKREDHCPWL